MNFARKELEKYGWTEGQGLGKSQTGIAKPLKPDLKFDNCGLGYDVGAQFTDNWWEKLFNKTAQNLSVEKKQDEVVMQVTPDDDTATKKHAAEYTGFLKTSRLDGNTVTDLDNNCYVKVDVKFTAMSDEELFAACSGRTAHKGARHGLKQSGKLSRIEKQEKMLLKKMKKISLNNKDDESNTDRKMKKLKKQLEKLCTNDTNVKTPTILKKKKKPKKTVSFNETVTKIITVDLDTSLESEVDSTTMEEHCDDVFLGNITSGSEEGVEHEQECSKNNDDPLATFFVDVSDLSKAERKKLKMKKKLKAKRNRYLEDANKTGSDHDSDKVTFDCHNEKILKKRFDCDNEKKERKRKYLNEFDNSSSQFGIRLIDFSDKNFNMKKRGKH